MPITVFVLSTSRDLIDQRTAVDDRCSMRSSSEIRRIGGGYAFIHRTLLEYFAGREPTFKS